MTRRASQPHPLPPHMHRQRARPIHTGTAAFPSRVCHPGVRGRSSVQQALRPDNRAPTGPVVTRREGQRPWSRRSGLGLDPTQTNPLLRHSTDTYDFILLKTARGKQSKTRADQWSIAAVQAASDWASKHQHIVHLPISFAQVYAPCMSSKHSPLTLCTCTTWYHMKPPKNQNITAQHRPDDIDQRKYLHFVFSLSLFFSVVLFFIGSDGRIISHKHHAAP